MDETNILTYNRVTDAIANVVMIDHKEGNLNL